MKIREGTLTGEDRLLVLEAMALGYILGQPQARSELFSQLPLHRWNGPLHYLAKMIGNGQKADAARMLAVLSPSIKGLIQAIGDEHRQINQQRLSTPVEVLAASLRGMEGKATSQRLEQKIKDLEEIKKRLQECRDEARSAEALEQPARAAS